MRIPKLLPQFPVISQKTSQCPTKKILWEPLFRMRDQFSSKLFNRIFNSSVWLAETSDHQIGNTQWYECLQSLQTFPCMLFYQLYTFPEWMLMYWDLKQVLSGENWFSMRSLWIYNLLRGPSCGSSFHRRALLFKEPCSPLATVASPTAPGDFTSYGKEPLVDNISGKLRVALW